MSAIADRLAQVQIDAPLVHRNLALYPLLAPGLALPGYRLLEAALADGSARVSEVSAEGSVPELRFINDGDLPVLLLDGEELIGAKQNRILNLTILVPAHHDMLIPVSCVETGRWHATSAHFAAAARTHFNVARARKAADVTAGLRRNGSRASDQGAVWADIEQRQRRFGVTSATGAAADLYAQQRAPLDDYRRAFTARPGQCGALFAIDGVPMGLDLFDNPATLAAVLPKLVESHALDALDALLDQPASAADTPHRPPAPAARIRPWLDAIARVPVERFAALGTGEDWRLLGETISGGALVLDGQVLHLCAFQVGGWHAPSAWDDNHPGARADGAPSAARLALATDRRLIRHRGDSRRHLRVSIQAPRQTGQRTPLDLALVLDRSGSMGGDKWPRAVAAALAAVDRLALDDRVALVVFDDQIETLLPLTAGNAARQRAAAALARVGPRGSTDLGGGWLAGCALIGEDPTGARLRRCFLLTDGQANVGIIDPATLAHHAAQLRQRGVVTTTFGVGLDYHEALLGQLADAGGGMFRHIPDAAGIAPAIDPELGDALEVVIADARLHLCWDGALRVEPLGWWPVAPEAQGLTIGLGDLCSEQVLDLLVALRFPPGPKDADCPLTVTLLDGDRPLAEARLAWTWVDSARRRAQPRDAEVERRVGEQLASQARREAAERNGRGDLKGAGAALRDAAERLRRLNPADRGLADLANRLEAEGAHHEQPLPPDVLKSAVAESRAVAFSRGADGSRRRGGPDAARTAAPARLVCLPVDDSPARARHCRELLDPPRARAAALGQGAVEAARQGFYTDADGQPVDWGALVSTAVRARHSLPPDATLPPDPPAQGRETRVQVINTTTLLAARRLVDRGARVLALNFANGIHPGGGFLSGARAQEEVLCRSSALYLTLLDDPMYAAHRARPAPDSTDWAILSPGVPVFRTDDGTPLPQPWLLDVLTCAAPYAPSIGQPRAGDLLARRIERVLAIARAFGYRALVLGAWGCGAYGNDPARTARDYHAALVAQAGAFDNVVFAITDWSTERRFLAPFAAVFGGAAQR